MIKVDELRNLNETDLRDKLNTLSEDLAKLLYQKRMGQVDKPHQFKQIKKDIARILTILKEKPLFDQYSNLKLTSFTYDITPNHNNLVAYCTFQEIRIVTSSQYGSLTENQVANPANTSQVNDGIQNPQEPTSTSVSDAGGLPDAA